jgi:peptidoglycan hydrolase-like protein with peptidoglycan-binding domain
MADTLWSDISEFQVPVADAYPHQFLCIRSNDGTYQDKHFDQNIAWCRQAVDANRMFGFMVYYFFRPSSDGAGVLMSRVGTPHPKMSVMIDVEGAGGQVRGDQSGPINAQFDQLAGWLGNPARVVGYGNVSDLNALWPQKPGGIRLVIAAYGSNPDYPGKFAHQFADNYNTPPFGASDFNSADGIAPTDMAHMLGITGGAPAPAPAPPGPAPIHPPPPPATAPPFPYAAGNYMAMPSRSSLCHSGHYGGPDAVHVGQWQHQMKARGWNIATDGDFGQQSDGVCRQFQGEKHLGVDGKVGPQTWGASWTAPL